MNNIFLEFPEFVETDPRTKRPARIAGLYTVTAEFQYVKHSISMPAELISGKSVLDLGCCTGATGAWALSNGATRYVGVELQEELANSSQKNMKLRFPDSDWEIVHSSFNKFFASNTEKFDIVVAFGVIYHGLHLEKFLKNIVALDPEYILVESIIPIGVMQLLQNIRLADKNGNTASGINIVHRLEDLPLIELKTTQGMAAETPGHRFSFMSAVPSKAAIQLLLWAENYELFSDLTKILRDLFPNDYAGRYSVRFCRATKKVIVPDFETTYTTPEIKLLTPFDISPNKLPLGEWTFNQSLGQTFEDRARQRIPNYDKVIDQTVQVCKKIFTDCNSRIIDVGSATGETIRKLFNLGFRNLVGVDPRSNMIDKVKDLPIAHWIHSNEFPINDGPYSAVCCNWFLHSITNKVLYLNNIYRGLDRGGILILTDKTQHSGIELELYQDFQRQQGVSEEEIATENLMLTDSIEWYIETLRTIGFKVNIINADYCFTTFLAVK